MQPDIDALHNHITIRTQTDCQINTGMPHKSPISHAFIARKTRKMLHCILSNFGI